MNRNIAELARLYGIQTSYVDMHKRKREANVESLLRVLAAMGAPADVDKAIRMRRRELARRRVEPVIVAWDGRLGDKRLPLGYHDVKMKGRETFVISAPRRAFFPGQPTGDFEIRNSKFPRRCWGLFAPLYALHSKRSPNIGDLTDFEALLERMGSFGGRVGATLPLLSAFLDQPFEPSPYSPASRLFWNELYIDVTKVPEFAASRKAQKLAERRPPKTEFIDYRKEMAYKRAILEELAAISRNNSKSGKEAEDYARFRAVTDRLATGWRQWPSRLRDGNIRKGDFDETTKNYHLYVQKIVQEQLADLSRRAAGRGQLLYLDLPLGLHPDSYDTWRNRDVFVRGVAGGAPPDIVFTRGQNWGFPPMHPEAMRLHKHQYTIAYIRNHLRFARLLRIDHVMGLHRLFWIPDGMECDKGVYVEYPAEEFYAIFSLESHRHQAGIVGENLGTVPPEVNSAMARHNIQQMYVVQYEIVGEPQKKTLRPVPKKSVASLNTHDMPPFQAFLEGRDIDDRIDLELLDEKSADDERRQRAKLIRALKRFLHTNEKGLFRAIVGWLAQSMANIVLVNAEDLWREVLPQNVPATSKERPNWRRRIRPGIDEIRRRPDVAGVLTDVSAQRS